MTPFVPNSYDIFGKATITSATGAVRAATSYSNRFFFTGREYLKEVGLYDYRNRVYSESLGRFLQTDPIRFRANDVNLYRYVGNDIVDLIDRLGLCCESLQAEVNNLTSKVQSSKAIWDADLAKIPDLQKSVKKAALAVTITAAAASKICASFPPNPLGCSLAVKNLFGIVAFLIIVVVRFLRVSIFETVFFSQRCRILLR